MKVSITKCKVHGEARWRVRWRLPGKGRQSRYFKTPKEAKAEKSAIEDQQLQAGRIWLTLTGPERNELAQLWTDAREGGYTLKEAVEFFLAGREKPQGTTTLKSAYDKFIEERETARRSKRTVAALRSNVGRFIEGRDNVRLSTVGLAACSKWMEQFKELEPTTWNSYRLSLVTFFNWCVERKLIASNPAEHLPLIDLKNVHRERAPAILSADQAEALLAATLIRDPGLIRYVSVCLFGGLRPDREAAELLPDDFKLEPGHIYVRSFSAKTGQRRFVEVHPTLAQWLELGGDYGRLEEDEGGVEEIKGVVNLRRRFERVRLAAGLVTKEEAPSDEEIRKKVKADRKRLRISGWEQDVMRHTFASHYLPLFGAEQTANQLGHGDYGMLFRHYRKLVTRPEAERFWLLTPRLVACRAMLRCLSRKKGDDHRENDDE